MGTRYIVCARYQRTAELVGRRWSAAIIRVTVTGAVRFSDIREAVPGLSARLLTQRLRELEAAGILERRALSASRVAYGLTSKGQALAEVLLELEHWAEDWAENETAE